MITYVCTPLLPSSPKKIRKATAPSSRSTFSSRPCPGSTGSTRRRSKAPAPQAPRAAKPPKAPRAPRAPKARRGTAGALPDPRPPKKWGPRWSKMVELGEKVMKKWWNMMKSCSSFFWGPLHKDMLLYYDTMMCFAIIVIVDNMDWHHWIIIGIPSQILITRGPTGLPECIRPKWVYDGLQHVIIDFIHGTKGLSPCRRCIAYRMSVCKKQL